VSSTLDANVLLYASDESSALHRPAKSFLRRLAAGTELVYLFWPTVMAYLRIATHPAIFRRPLSEDEAASNVESLLSLAHVRSPGEADGFWKAFRGVCGPLVVRGNLVPDAHVVALMRLYGVSEIWTRDRDYRKFAGVRVLDPFQSVPDR
jgi:toxin-antitoxin system PIN domain toxin